MEDNSSDNSGVLYQRRILGRIVAVLALFALATCGWTAWQDVGNSRLCRNLENSDPVSNSVPGQVTALTFHPALHRIPSECWAKVRTSFGAGKLLALRVNIGRVCPDILHRPVTVLYNKHAPYQFFVKGYCPAFDWFYIGAGLMCLMLLTVALLLGFTEKI